MNSQAPDMANRSKPKVIKWTPAELEAVEIAAFSVSEPTARVDASLFVRQAVGQRLVQLWGDDIDDKRREVITSLMGEEMARQWLPKRKGGGHG